MGNKNGLKRDMGLFSAVCVLVGTVIGSGIFTTPGQIAASAGSFGPNMLAWIIAGSSAVLFSGLHLSVTGQRMVATALILILSFVNILGVKNGAVVQNIFTIAKVVVLVSVIVGGIVALKPENFMSMTTETVEWGNSFATAVPALNAFGGYYVLSYMSGEIKNPKRNLPLATIIGMGVVIIINMLLTVACVGSVGFADLAGSATPVSAAAQAAFGKVGATLITLGATISIFGSTNGSLLSMPRVAYAMAENDMMFPFFAKLHPKYKTPYITIMIYAIVAVFFVWTGSFMTLLMMSTFVGCLSEVAVCLSLIILRKKKPDMERPFKMWGYPVTAILATLITFILVCCVSPAQILSGSFLMLTSVPAYFIFRATKKKKSLVESMEQQEQS